MLTLSILGKSPTDDIMKYFSYFSHKRVFDILYKLPHLGTICMKRQILFSGKKKTKISVCHLLNLSIPC